MSRSEHHSTSTSIAWHENQGVRYVTVIGEIELSNADALTRALSAPQVHIDMTRVSFIDSASVRCLVNARMGATEFELVANRVVLRLLDLAAVTDLLNATHVVEPDPV